MSFLEKAFMKVRDDDDAMTGCAPECNSYIRIDAPQDIKALDNTFTVNGEDKKRIIRGAVNAYQVPEGVYTVHIFSGNGKWCEITEHIGRGQVLMINVEVEDGNICKTAHVVYHAGMTESLCPSRLEDAE